MIPYSKLSQLHFYTDRTNKSQAYRIEVDLTETINDAVLLDALKKALPLFPAIACRAYIMDDKKHMGMVPNDQAPVIYHEDVPAALGTAESNGYLFRVISLGSKLVFSVFHALCDAYGAKSFVTHLLYFYFTGLGYPIDPEGAILTPEDLSDENLTASLEEKLNAYGISEGCWDPNMPAPDRIFREQRETQLYDTDKYSVTRFVMPFTQMKKLMKDLGTTPLPLFYVLGSQAMRETSDVGDKILHCCFSVDLRSRLCSRSTTEFCCIGNLFYTSDDEKQPLEKQLQKAKESLDKVLADDFILRCAKNFADTYDMLLPYIDFTLKDFIQPALSRKSKENSSSLFITNVGLFRFPKDMTPLIKDVQIVGPPAKLDPTLSIHTYGENFYLNYIHNSTDDAHIDRIAEKLRAMGVDVTLLLKRTQKTDYLGKLQPAPHENEESRKDYLLENGSLTVYPAGELNLAAGKELSIKIDSLLKDGGISLLVFDLSGLTHIAPDGLRVVLRYLNKTPTLRVVNASPEVYKEFDATGMTKIVDIQKQPPTVNVSASMHLGSGTTAEVYRLDDEKIVKAYRPNQNPDWIEAQRCNAQQLWLHGIPSAVPYEAVNVYGLPGAVYEYLDGVSLGEAISREPELLDEYAKKLAALLRQIHRTKFDKNLLTDTLDYLAGHFNVRAINKYTSMDVAGFATALNKGKTLVHGDFHPMNVLVKDHELILIDTGDAYFRYGFLDHVTLFTYLILQADSAEKSQKMTGMTPEHAHRLWDGFVQNYFVPKSEDEKNYINTIIRRMAMVRVAMAFATMNELDDAYKSTAIPKILSSAVTDLDAFKQEIDAFEAKYEG